MYNKIISRKIVMRNKYVQEAISKLEKWLSITISISFLSGDNIDRFAQKMFPNSEQLISIG
jgi:hypothetical protein